VTDETGGESDRERSGGGIRFWIPALIAGTSMFLGVLDTSMMNVAVPVIVRDLGTTVSAMHAAIAVYSMVMAALIVPGGALRAVLDTRRLLVGALCLYGVGTFVAGVSPNMTTLFVGWSIIEGIAAAFLLPMAFSIVTENYEGATRAKAFGAIGAAGAAGAALGPMIGGVLTTFASWRWGMFGELILVIGLLGLTRSLPSRPRNREVAVDVGGTILSILGVVAIVAGSVLAGHYGWIRPRARSSSLVCESNRSGSRRRRGVSVLEYSFSSDSSSTRRARQPRDARCWFQ